jgi:hypothetical protein
MSYVLDGKIANQSCKIRLDGFTACEKCNKAVKRPERVMVKVEQLKKSLLCFSYVGSSSYIYETKIGIAVVYCSEYCRNKHNHRF